MPKVGNGVAAVAKQKFDAIPQGFVPKYNATNKRKRYLEDRVIV